MQPVEDTYEVYKVGSTIQERYLVEGTLGQGGFGIVYLVRDQSPNEEQKHSGADHRFALKMLIDQDKKERARFLFEGEVLTRLNHPALPHIYRTFEIADSQEACVLMDYVEGMSLESLRKRPAEEHVSLAQALSILAPIVEALTYLHSQPSPIIHRDVKPANVIVRKDGTGAVLVDFGIAKEFEQDATTTAVRHCSPGYGAPEQYSSVGTDQRTDVYGLGATLYALLSQVVPVDSLTRLTCLANERKDPLIPIRQLVPDLPESVAEVIQHSLAIDMRRRFSSIDEFWQALQKAVNDAHSRPFRKNLRFKAGSLPVTPRMTQQMRLIPGRTRRLAFGALAIALLGSLIFGFSAYFARTHNASTNVGAISPGHTTPAPQRPAATPVSYPVVAQAYQGEIHDMLSNATTPVTLTHVEQNNNQLGGSFSGSHMQGTFTGVLDTSRHIFFTVVGHPSLFFQGAVRSDGNLVGNYCAIDSAGQCVGSYGIWSLAPIYRETT